MINCGGCPYNFHSYLFGYANKCTGIIITSVVQKCSSVAMMFEALIRASERFVLFPVIAE